MMRGSVFAQLTGFLGCFFFSINLFILFIYYFWLHWVFVAACGLSLVAASGATLCCGAWTSHCGASLQ